MEEYYLPAEAIELLSSFKGKRMRCYLYARIAAYAPSVRTRATVNCTIQMSLSSCLKNIREIFEDYGVPGNLAIKIVVKGNKIFIGQSV